MTGMTGTPDFGLPDVRMLGPLEVRYRHRPVTLPEGQPKKIVAQLTLHPEDGLKTAELVTGTGTTAGTLDNSITSLRKSLGRRGLGQVLERIGNGYRLKFGSTDAEQFKGLLRQAQKTASRGELEPALEQAEDALRLWRGDEPLPGLSCPGLDGVIHDLKQRHTAARRLWCELSLRLGRHEEALPLLRLLAGSDPLNESVCELLIIPCMRWKARPRPSTPTSSAAGCWTRSRARLPGPACTASGSRSPRAVRPSRWPGGVQA